MRVRGDALLFCGALHLLDLHGAGECLCHARLREGCAVRCGMRVPALRGLFGSVPVSIPVSTAAKRSASATEQRGRSSIRIVDAIVHSTCHRRCLRLHRTSPFAPSSSLPPPPPQYNDGFRVPRPGGHGHPARIRPLRCSQHPPRHGRPARRPAARCVARDRRRPCPSPLVHVSVARRDSPPARARPSSRPIVLLLRWQSAECGEKTEAEHPKKSRKPISRRTGGQPCELRLPVSIVTRTTPMTCLCSPSRYVGVQASAPAPPRSACTLR